MPSSRMGKGPVLALLHFRSEILILKCKGEPDRGEDGKWVSKRRWQWPGSNDRERVAGLEWWEPVCPLPSSTPSCDTPGVELSEGGCGDLR